MTECRCVVATPTPERERCRDETSETVWRPADRSHWRIAAGSSLNSLDYLPHPWHRNPLPREIADLCADVLQAVNPYSLTRNAWLKDVDGIAGPIPIMGSES